MKFRKKPIVIDAEQWFENGDHSEDATEMIISIVDGEPFKSEGKTGRYFRHPEISGYTECKHCGKRMHVHGWIDTLEGGHIVCPSDWIIKGIKGEFYPCKSDVFEKTYEPVDL